MRRALEQDFVRRARLDPDDLVVLNGLPRHVEQARDVDAHVRVEAVILLDCTPEVALERIRTNAGGDRGGRADDNVEVAAAAAAAAAA